MNRRWVFLKEASCLRFFSVLRLTILSVLKDLEALLFVEDFALCICTKLLPYAQRLMYLCVNSVQAWVSKNGFKFSTSKTVCMHFCNQHKHCAEQSILLDKTPIRVVTEVKFLGVIFGRILSYNSHVKYLRSKLWIFF